MELLTSATISATFEKVILNGSNLMTKELENLIPAIFRLSVLVVSIGEGKAKVLIFWSMKE